MLTVIVVLALAGFTGYVVYQDERRAGAVMAAIAAIGVLYLLLGPVPGAGHAPELPFTFTASADAARWR
ncbi:hypothetical protein [Streptomyces sp. BK205]|uniref:hypothetical protein n=1 Tax=Streptomyces sp. BK205 TaxID=2512164 RepID=UPI00105366CF|nr:hypothetical protein [Streptomyces sp. BK205]TCR15925.1 hypothetical protein EV578_11537 [Streptomyces sp. BK205]